MKRMYTVAFYDEMLQRIRETIPEATVTSDFIVGFCGETEESFDKSMRLVERSRFKNSYIFKYSTREGTKADSLYPDDIPEDVKKRRNNDLLTLQNSICFAENQKLIGRTYEVLVEGPSKSAAKFEEGEGFGQFTGRTMCDRIVVFPGHERLVGKTVPVTIEDASAVTLFGEALTYANTEIA